MKKYPSKIFRDKFFGAPYKFGGQSKEEGFDCLSCVENFYKELGKNVPSFADLYSVYENDFVKAKRSMWRRIFKSSKETTIDKAIPGDLVIFKHLDFGNYPSIFLGNGNIGASFSDKGVVVLDMRDLDIVSVRSWN